MSQVGIQQLGVPVLFYSSCRTWFNKTIEGTGGTLSLLIHYAVMAM